MLKGIKATKAIIFAFMLAVTATGCGEKKGADIEAGNSNIEPTINAENTGLDWQKTSTTTTATETTETTTTEETTTTTVTSGTEETTETGSTPTKPPVSSGGQKAKVNKFTRSYVEEGETFERNYCFVPEEATELSDDVKLGLITVDGKEFDINNLANAYGEDEIKNVFGEQAGLYSSEKLIADGIFDDVCIATKGSPFEMKFIFGENKGVEEVEVNQEVYGFNKSKGAYDFLTVEYVNGWFRGLHSKCLAMNAPPSTVEQITVKGEEKPFVEVVMGDPSPQLTTNTDKLITYTDKNIAVGDGTTFGDIVAMFGAEPTYVDIDLGVGNIYTYRNSTVTVGFVTDYSADLEDLNEEERNSSPIIAVYQWLNE